MSTRQLSGIEQDLITTAQQLAQQYAAGGINSAELRRQMRQALEVAHTAAMLSGTDRQRNADIDAALREAIQNAMSQLDAAIGVIERREPNVREITQRLEAFVDTLEDTQQTGEDLAQRPTSPLIPLAVGGALAALLARATQRQAPAQQRVTLPRIDAGQVQRIVNTYRGNVDVLAEQLANGLITQEEWYTAMRRQVIQSHTAMYRAGVGRTLTDADINRIEQRVIRQIGYLDNWRDEIARDGVPSEAALRNRSNLYVNATNATLQEGRTGALGLPPLPAYPKDGTTICRTNCQCNWRIVQLDGPGNFDAYWRLNPAEHCDTCIARARAWNPIQIRNGVLQRFERIFD